MISQPRLWWLFGVGVFLVMLFLGARYLGFGQTGVIPGQRVQISWDERAYEDIPSALAEPANVLVEAIVTGLDTPWSIVFTSPERMLVTERPGRIRVVENGVLKPEPLHVFSEISERGEEGLLSMTLDPSYPENRFLYVVIAYPRGSDIIDKVVRLRDDGSRLSDTTVLLDGIPAARFHAGSRIAFGPDGKMYVSTGDATDKNLAQDMQSLAGKILRINTDGSIPEDNPFPGSLIWSLGHRNPQGLAWHPDTGALYETEHGPSGFDGAGGGDEVNRIEKGKNYGWPLVSHEKRRVGTEVPLLLFTPAEAPASLLIYSGRAFPEWRGNLFFGALKGEGLMQIVLDDQDASKAESYEKRAEVNFGRIREVMEGPDGFIYFTTSNRDGRGTPGVDDDRIFRLRPGE